MRVLRRIEALLPQRIARSCETGCGKSTIMFSALSERHTVFCIDDRAESESSINYFQQCELTRNDRIELVLGPTQVTLPTYQQDCEYDVILIDGPHGYPFPELEYLFLYPSLKKDGLLILDDVHIATIGRLADFVNEDAMFEQVELVSTTAVFRRTDVPTFDPRGDGWWLQNYNRRRIAADNKYVEPYRLADGGVKTSFADQLSRIAPRGARTRARMHRFGAFPGKMGLAPALSR